MFKYWFVPKDNIRTRQLCTGKWIIEFFTRFKGWEQVRWNLNSDFWISNTGRYCPTYSFEYEKDVKEKELHFRAFLGE